jgi:glycerol-3-phosphate dehydrogenase (NAD(P)+)
VALSLASTRENTAYLPGHALPQSIQIASEPGPAIMEAEVICLACPSKGLRGLCEQLVEGMKEARQLRLFVILSKGMEMESFKTPTEVVGEYFPGTPCGILSGPTYAGDVAAGLPAAITLALKEGVAEAGRYQAAFSSDAMRVYRSLDVRGTELGGTLKNIYAIAAGLCDGLHLGDNAKAALLTRSMHEMVQLGVSLGGQQATFHGLSGFGDLIATCTGSWSRNRTLGQSIGEGKGAEAILEHQSMVTEGYHATRCLYAMCEGKDLHPPILSEVHAILFEGKSPEDALQSLMQRELKEE